MQLENQLIDILKGRTPKNKRLNRNGIRVIEPRKLRRVTALKFDSLNPESSDPRSFANWEPAETFEVAKSDR